MADRYSPLHRHPRVGTSRLDSLSFLPRNNRFLAEHIRPVICFSCVTVAQTQFPIRTFRAHSDEKRLEDKERNAAAEGTISTFTRNFVPLLVLLLVICILVV